MGRADGQTERLRAMGNGTSMEASKAIYVIVKGNTQKVGGLVLRVFTMHIMSSRIVNMFDYVAIVSDAVWMQPRRTRRKHR